METIEFIKKSLDYFDKQNYKYSNFIKNTSIIIKNNQILDKTEIILSNFIRQVLGVYHYSSNVFFWGWVLPFLSVDEIKISRELLNYGLTLDPNTNTYDHFFLKSLLVNSRININTCFDLDLIQAISAYILKDKYTFIYPYSLKDNNNNIIITTFFLIKISNE